MNKILAFVDLLGFTRMIEKDYEKSKQLLTYFYQLVFSVLEGQEGIKGNMSSDCLLIYSDEYPDLINSLSKIYRICFKYNGQISVNPDFYLLPRGAISIGYMEIGDRDTSLHLTKDFMIGPALVHSSKLEQLIKGSRLLIAVNNEDVAQVAGLRKNKNIASPLYDNCTFKFWENYSYVDTLWFLDLSKSESDQEAEVLELIDIAVELLLVNQDNKNVIEHYINTLRIGLLSYSKFLLPEKDPIIKRMLDEFHDDRYWLIWLTIIEVLPEITISLENYLLKFFKSACLRPGWMQVIEEINKPEKEYLKKRCAIVFNNL